MLRVVCAAALLLSMGATAQNPIAQARSKMGDYRSALTQASRTADANAAGQFMTEAQAHLRDAVSLFEEGGAAHSDDPDVLSDYADVLLILKSPDLAEPVLVKATEHAPRNAEIWLRLGNARTELGPRAMVGAINAFDAALEHGNAEATRAEAQSGAGYAYFINGYYDLSARRYAAALEIDPEYTRALIGQAAIELRNGMAVEAAARLDAAGDLPPDLAREQAITIGAAADAVRQTGIPINDDATSLVAYARVLVRVNRLAEALGPLEHAAAIEADNTTAWNLIGALRHALGDTVGAKDAYERSLAINPDQPRTRQAVDALGAG